MTYDQLLGISRREIPAVFPSSVHAGNPADFTPQQIIALTLPSIAPKNILNLKGHL